MGFKPKAYVFWLSVRLLEIRRLLETGVYFN